MLRPHNQRVGTETERGMAEQGFRIGSNCWRVETAERMAVVVDAADYFRVARDAMLQAREQILLVGWDVDPRILLDPDLEGEGPEGSPNRLASAHDRTLASLGDRREHAPGHDCNR